MRQATAHVPAMTQAASQAMTGAQPPGGTPGIGTQPPGVLLGTIDTPFESNMRIYSAGQTDRCFMNGGRPPNEGIYNFNDGTVPEIEWHRNGDGCHALTFGEEWKKDSCHQPLTSKK